MSNSNLKLRCEYQCKDSGLAQPVTYIEGTQAPGEAFQPIRDLTFDPTRLSAEIQNLCLSYGLRAILADRTSDAKKLGVNKLDWMADVYAMLESGEWNKKPEKKGSVDKALALLIVQLKGCTQLEAEAALKTTDKEWRDALADRYAEELAAIRKEMAEAEKVDLGDLL